MMEDPQTGATSCPETPTGPPSPIGGRNGVVVTLEDRDLWMKFHQEGTEMVITKSGRRMFPQCKVRVTGLTAHAKYLMMVDFVPVDNFRYKWNKDRWEVAGKAETQPPCRTYVHPDSPALGGHWTKEVVSFQKLKLTNNTLDQQGHVILHSMHRYQPRFHVLRVEDFRDGAARWSAFQTFTFPEMAFTSVTAYQNEKITTLKIYNNPFAKGFREQGRNGSREGRLQMNSQKKRELMDETKTGTEEEEKMNADAKQRGPAAKAEKEDRRRRGSHTWVSGHDGGTLHRPTVETQTQSSERHGTDDPRQDFWNLPDSPSFAPEAYLGPAPAVLAPSFQDYDLYVPEQSFGQWMVAPGTQYRPTVGYGAFSRGEFGAAQGGSGRGPPAECGQCPLFPYGCW